MIRYNLYQHPHDENSEHLGSFESAYSITDGATVETATGAVTVKKVVVRTDGSVDLYVHAVLGMSLF